MNINSVSSDWSVGDVALLEKKIIVEYYDRVHDQLVTQESNFSIDTVKLLSLSMNTSLDEYMYQPRQISSIILDIVIVVHKKQKNKNRNNKKDSNNSNNEKKKKNNKNDPGNDDNQEEINSNQLEFTNLQNIGRLCVIVMNRTITD